MPFAGFEAPHANFSKFPHSLVDSLPDFTSHGELACVVYVLRHTWGYQEFGKPKQITLDEFEHGRLRRDGTRMDRGIGLSRPTIILGLKRAVENGFLVLEIDDHDKARIIHSYGLNMRAEDGAEDTETDQSETDQGYGFFTPDKGGSGKDSLPRTEKEKKETLLGGEGEQKAKPKGTGRSKPTRATALIREAPEHDWETYWHEWTDQYLTTEQAGEFKKYSDFRVLSAMKMGKQKRPDWPYQWVKSLLVSGHGVKDAEPVKAEVEASTTNIWADALLGE